MDTLSWHGDPAVRIAGPGLTAVVLPGRGGRIASIVDASGREWLEQPRLPLVPVAELPADFVAGDMFGWDECAPTIDACVVGDWPMPDHGDVWDRAWTVDGDGLVITNPAGTYTLRRSITVVDHGLRLDYEASTTLEEFPFLWSAHPQFAAPPGTAVVLAEAVGELIDGEDPALTRYPNTPGFLGIDAVPAGGSRKLFVDPDLRLDRCRLVRPDGAELELRWDSSVSSYLGLWYDQSEYSRGPVIAVEPMTGFFDVCATALARGRVTVLRSGEPLRWWVELEALAV